MSSKVPHPGRSRAQRAVLDAIGCGNNSPSMATSTRTVLLKAGLIRKCGERLVGRDRFGDVVISEYEMPFPVHMQWCAAVATGPSA